MRRLAIFTGSRAEYGLMRQVVRLLSETSDCELFIVATGSHLSAQLGHTISEIEADSFAPLFTVDMMLEDMSPSGICVSTGHCVSGLGAFFKQYAPELFVVLGDRYETLAAALAATLCGVPLAHIAGGEDTTGAMDDNFRHAITKLAHLHFTTCEPYRMRVIHMGENPDRVWNVGGLGEENAQTLTLPDEAAIRDILHLSATRPYILCTFHPVTLERDTETKSLQELLDALASFPDYTIIFTAANADPGGEAINAILHKCCIQDSKRYRFFPSLGMERYLAAAKYASCVVGNSSSGVHEIPSLGTPVVDIGSRQQGRIRSKSVLHAEVEKSAIQTALVRALAPEYRNWSASCINPYDKPGTAAAIVEKLLTIPLEGLRYKKFYEAREKV